KPFLWTYPFFWGLEDIIAVFTDMWSQVDNNKVVAALWPNDGDGNAWGDKKLGCPPALPHQGGIQDRRPRPLPERHRGLILPDRRVQGGQGRDRHRPAHPPVLD